MDNKESHDIWVWHIGKITHLKQGTVIRKEKWISFKIEGRTVFQEHIRNTILISSVWYQRVDFYLSLLYVGLHFKLYVRQQTRKQKKTTICFYSCVQKVGKKNSYFQTLAMFHRCQRQIIIIDVILHSGMERNQEYTDRQYIQFWYLTKRNGKVPFH